jgi:hypothetical protein
MKRLPNPTPWTSNPYAAAILAICGHDPPARRTIRYRFADTGTLYTGERVRALKRLYRAAEPPLDTPAWRAWLTLDVARAIDTAIDALRSRRSAA